MRPVRAQEKDTARVGRIGLVVLASVSIAGTLLWPAVASMLGGGIGADRVTVMASDAPLGWFGVFSQISPAAVSIPVALTLIVTWITWRKRAEWGVLLASWSAFYFIYLMIVTPPHTGIMRYLLLAFPFGMLLTGSSTWSAERRTLSLAVGTAILLVLQVLWIRFSFVYGSQAIMP